MSHFNSPSGLLPRRGITKLPMSVCPGSDLRNKEVDPDKTMESDSTICLLGVQLDPLGSNSQIWHIYLALWYVQCRWFWWKVTTSEWDNYTLGQDSCLLGLCPWDRSYALWVYIQHVFVLVHLSSIVTHVSHPWVGGVTPGGILVSPGCIFWNFPLFAFTIIAVRFFS